MINVNEVLKNLEKLVGTEFDVDDIIIAFGDNEEEVIVEKVIGQESHFEGYGMCDCYNAYENTEDSEVFSIYVDEDNEIVDVSLL